MKKQFLSALFLFISIGIWAQSDNCSSATVITPTAACSSPVSGTTIGATQSIPGCSGTADDDVWYQFTATATAHEITVVPSASMDPVVQLFSGPCASLVSLVCKDNGANGTTETINYSGLTIGNVYTIRVYHYGTGAGSGTFTICVADAPIAPSNDDCAGATPLNVNSTCVSTLGTTNGASQSQAGCAGNADDDVWYSFVATNSLQTIQVNPLSNIDLVFQVFSGSCGSLSSLACIDNTFTAQAEQTDVVGLVAGQTYFVRVYDYYGGNTGDFEICVVGDPTPVPSNDDPCSAILLPEVTATCQYSQFTTVGATATSSGDAPTPSTCAGGSGAAIGGYSTSSSDIWFKIIVPQSGSVDVTAQPNGGAGAITDGVMALYSAPNCSSLTQIACSDDNPTYPGSSNDLLPFISESGLTPGDTVYLRYWGFGTSTGSFGICVSTTENDDCANALYICDINGYSASTSASYTPDRPDNMRGNNEDVNGTNMPDGVNTGGIFGQGGPWGTGAPAFDVIINNNSWIKFTAASTSAVLDVNIYDCWVGNYPSGGVQMQIFEGTNCTNFVPVSNFEESSTGFQITANGLTVGNDYYLMVDGYAGDICNYTITANSGVQFPDIADVPPICIGESVTLTAPPGATSYEWQHDNSTGQTVTVTPSNTQTYVCEVTGLCDYKQTLDVTVQVNQLPNVQVTNGSSVAICDGSSETLIASGAQSYLWSTTQTGTSITVSPTSNTTYSVIGTDANGCENSANVNVVINPLPTLAAAPTSNDAGCGLSDGSLTGTVISGNGPFTYSWSNGSTVVGTNVNLTGIPAGTYTLTVTDANLCSATFGPFSVSNPGAPPAPSVTATDETPCFGFGSQLNATNTMAGVSYSWTGPNGFTATGSTVNLPSVTANEQGTYCVSSTVAGCTGPSACINILFDAPPTVDVSIAGNDSTICENGSIDLQGSGAVTYAWSGPNGFTANSSSATVNNATTANQGYYVITGTDANGCSSSDSMLVSLVPLPTITLSADDSNNTYCGGGIATLTASGASTYIWSGPNNYSNTANPISLLNLSAASVGYYVVTGTDAEGCMNSDSLMINVVTDVPATSSDDIEVCPGDQIDLEGSGGSSYTWSGPNGFTSNDQDPLVTNSAAFEDAGIYILTVVDADGCLGYDSTIVVVSNNADCLFIPNLTTPDGDLMNDTWVINGLEKYPEAEVEIYNRWGNLVYSSSPYNNDWDGSVNQGAVIDGNNGKVPVGTYFYIIRLNEGDKPPYKGYLEVQY